MYTGLVSSIGKSHKHIAILGHYTAVSFYPDDYSIRPPGPDIRIVWIIDCTFMLNEQVYIPNTPQPHARVNSKRSRKSGIWDMGGLWRWGELGVLRRVRPERAVSQRRGVISARTCTRVWCWMFLLWMFRTNSNTSANNTSHINQVLTYRPSTSCAPVVHYYQMTCLFTSY